MASAAQLEAIVSDPSLQCRGRMKWRTEEGKGVERGRDNRRREGGGRRKQDAEGREEEVTRDRRGGEREREEG